MKQLTTEQPKYRCAECGEDWPCWYSLNKGYFNAQWIVSHVPKEVKNVT